MGSLQSHTRYFRPGHKFEFLVFGFLWEYLEFLLSDSKEFWSEKNINTVWDMWFNLFGYWLGELLDGLISDRTLIRIMVVSYVAVMGTLFSLGFL